MSPLVIGELLRKLRSCPNLGPRERLASTLDGAFNSLLELFVRGHGKCLRMPSWSIPIGTLALGTSFGLDVQVSWNPFVVAAFTAATHNGNRDPGQWDVLSACRL